jgi:hypothetical protein
LYRLDKGVTNLCPGRLLVFELWALRLTRCKPTQWLKNKRPGAISSYLSYHGRFDG